MFCDFLDSLHNLNQCFRSKQICFRSEGHPQSGTLLSRSHEQVLNDELSDSLMNRVYQDFLAPEHHLFGHLAQIYLKTVTEATCQCLVRVTPLEGPRRLYSKLGQAVKILNWGLVFEKLRQCSLVLCLRFLIYKPFTTVGQFGIIVRKWCFLILIWN